MSEPPVAPRRPAPFTRHGITIADDYAWLKDPNWQDVLRDPGRLSPDQPLPATLNHFGLRFELGASR